MKKIYLSVIIGILAVAGVVWLSLPQPTEAPDGETFVPEVVSENTPEAGVGSLASLVTRGERLECTFQYRTDLESTTITGSYFVADGQVRGDVVQQDPTLGEVLTSFIVTADDVFVWSLIAGETYGVRTSGGFETGASELPLSLDMSVRYTCVPWVAYDGSIFEPPSTVLFRDAASVPAEFGTIYESAEF